MPDAVLNVSRYWPGVCDRHDFLRTLPLLCVLSVLVDTEPLCLIPVTHIVASW